MIKVFEVFAEDDTKLLEGVMFTDTSVAVHWLGEHRSTAVWAQWSDFVAVSLKPEYARRIEWLLG